MGKTWIRVWQGMDLEDIAKHLVIAGDITGDCANCKEIGIDFTSKKSCPSCKAEFKYISSRNPKAHSRVRAKRSDLIFIDYQDFKQAQEKFKAKKFFA